MIEIPETREAVEACEWLLDRMGYCRDREMILECATPDESYARVDWQRKLNFLEAMLPRWRYEALVDRIADGVPLAPDERTCQQMIDDFAAHRERTIVGAYPSCRAVIEAADPRARRSWARAIRRRRRRKELA